MDACMLKQVTATDTALELGGLAVADLGPARHLMIVAGHCASVAVMESVQQELALVMVTRMDDCTSKEATVNVP
eukprot:3628590-Amphidinium_carterae.1